MGRYVEEEELRAAYRSAGAIVDVSDTEGFGLPPLEALTYGTPAVLADTPANRELYGLDVFYVPVPITVAGIAAAMKRSTHDTAAGRGSGRRARRSRGATRGPRTPTASCR